MRREQTTKNKYLVALIAFLVIWSAIAIVAVTWETSYDWPDNVHRDYGFPLVWSTQTLSTIIGPVDLWTVNISALMLDLAFWLVLMLVVAIVMFVLFRRKP